MSFNVKFTAKIDFSIRYFYVTIADADTGKTKVSSYIIW